MFYLHRLSWEWRERDGWAFLSCSFACHKRSDDWPRPWQKHKDGGLHQPITVRDRLPKQEVTSHPAQCQNTASSGGETNNEPSWRWVCCMDTFHLLLSTSQRTCLWDIHTGKSSCVNISHTSSMDALYSSIVQEPQPVFVMFVICKQPLHSAQNVWPSCTSEWENVSFLFTFLDLKYVTLEHKTSHKGQFWEIEIYASSESWIDNISIDAWFVMMGQYLKGCQKI